MSLFGGGGAFGNTNAAGAGGGLFGSNAQQQGQQQQQQPAAGGLFGNTTGTTGGGPFGNTNTATTGTAQPLQAQPTQPATAFGATNTNTNTNTNTAGTGGGLFGSTNTGGMFGSTSTNPGNAGGGLFGNAQSNAPTGGGGGLFGNTQASNPGGGGLFGNTNPAPSGNLFGANANPAAGTTGGGGLFGSTNNVTGTSGGGLFGSTANTNTNTGGGLFGSNTQPNNATGGGLFGSTNTNTGGGLFGAAKPAGTGLFGSTTGTTGGGLFGSTNTQQQQPQQQQQSSGLFGQSTLGVSALGSTLRPASSTSQLTDAQNQYIQMTEKIKTVYQAWDADSPQCRFQHPFYNLVDPSQVALYGRPANAKNDTVWEKAVREKPDPSCFVPVIAIGFDDVRSRVEAQSTQTTEQSQKLTDLKTRLSNLQSRHSVSNVARLQRAIATQTQITHRLLKMLQHLHLLIPAVRSSAIRPEEEGLRTRLEEIEDELRKGRVKSKVNELWALVGAVSASVERGSRGAGGEWAVVDEEGMAQIVQVLKDQQTGLAYLTKVLQKAKADMAIVLGQNPNEELTLPEEENLWGSTSTLRASALR